MEQWSVWVKHPLSIVVLVVMMIVALVVQSVRFVPRFKATPAYDELVRGFKKHGLDAEYIMRYSALNARIKSEHREQLGMRNGQRTRGNEGREPVNTADKEAVSRIEAAREQDTELDEQMKNLGKARTQAVLPVVLVMLPLVLMWGAFVVLAHTR